MGQDVSAKVTKYMFYTCLNVDFRNPSCIVRLLHRARAHDFFHSAHRDGTQDDYRVQASYCAGEDVPIYVACNLRLHVRA
jgi:hypothetical protein